MRTKEVFTPGTFPTYTFVAEHLTEKRRRFKDAIEAGASVLALSGPSKSGKTVFIEEIIGQQNLVHVTGAGVKKPADLWSKVFDIVGTDVTREITATVGYQSAFGGKIGADAGFLLSAKGEVNATGTSSSQEATKGTKAIDYVGLLIRDFAKTDFVLFLDDFHYIDREAQSLIAQQIKEMIRQGVTIVCACVPYHSDDVLRANADLRGRITTFDFDYWTAHHLEQIAKKGFGALGVEVQQSIASRLAAEAAGSPQLMQALCLNAAFEAGVYEQMPDTCLLPPAEEFLDRVCQRTAMSADYSSVVERMREGPKIRGQIRKEYGMKNGAKTDVYPIVLSAIAQDPPQLRFRYQALVKRVESVCDGEAPSGSSMTGACEHIATIGNATAGQSVVEWDAENDVLDIRDPYLLFYLRWVFNEHRTQV
jgi:hypothetical protein